MPTHAAASPLTLFPPAPESPDDPALERILEAALELFAHFGIKRTSMEDVARKAGVGRTTIYRRFSDKGALAQAVALREGRRFIEAVEAAVAPVADPVERLLTSFVTSVRWARQMPLLQGLLKVEPEVILPFLTVNGGMLFAMALPLSVAAIRERQAEGAFPGVDAGYLADMLIRLFQSIVLTPSPLIHADDDAQVQKFAHDFLRPLLQGQ
jgi:AcrR family transcriptional regulator